MLSAETSQVCYHTMQEDFTQNRLHPDISMRFETCEVWVRLFKCVSPIYNSLHSRIRHLLPDQHAYRVRNLAWMGSGHGVSDGGTGSLTFVFC